MSLSARARVCTRFCFCFLFGPPSFPHIPSLPKPETILSTPPPPLPLPHNFIAHRGTIFDAKFFCELRPGLIGLVALNMGMAQKQKELHGEYSWDMLSINVFQGLYVWDALYHERSVLTTMDITTDGFGFMLVFGDLCWVPFTYGIQAR